MATAGDPAARDPQITTLTVPGGDLAARFAVGAGMVGCSLTHDGEELLGLRGGRGAHRSSGKTFGLPLLHPWASRLGAWEYAARDRRRRGAPGPRLPSVPRAPGAPRADWAIDLPAMTHLALDDRGLPAGAAEPRPAETFVLAARTFDDLYALDPGPARFAVADGARQVAVVFEEGFTDTQVFAPMTRGRRLLRADDRAGRRVAHARPAAARGPGTDARAVFAVMVRGH